MMTTGTTTAPAREVLEMIARCEAVMVLYHNAGRTEKAYAEMAREVQTIARLAGGLGLEPALVETDVIRPVKAGLLSRYGNQMGARVFSAFLDAYRGAPRYR